MSEATIVGGLFVVGGAVFGGGTAWLWYQAKRSAAWPSVAGLVREVEVTAGRTGRTHRLRVRYAYDVDGRALEGDRMAPDDLLWTWSGTRDDATWRARRYPVGGAVTVYFDPASPARCALSRGPGEASPYGRNLAIAALLFAAGWGAVLGWIEVG